jgi:thioredoxin reductase (NADPH)
MAPGGQLTVTTDVENYPGYADVIQGPWLMEQMQKQAAHVGTKLVADHVSKIDLARRPFRLDCDSGDVYFAEALILATGAQARWLDLPCEKNSAAMASPPAPPAMGSFIAASRCW